MRKAGVDHSVIMKLTGHKTPSMFQRYNTMDLDDAKNAYQKLHTLLEQGDDSAPAGKCSQRQKLQAIQAQLIDFSYGSARLTGGAPGLQIRCTF